MNIFKLRIQFKFRKTLHKNIIKSIQSAYAERYSDSSGYMDFIQGKWENLDYKNVKALYEKDQVIVRAEIENSTYFILKEEKNNDLNKVLLTTLILSNENNSNNVFNKVLKDIKEKVGDEKIELLVPKNGNIAMYLFDERTKDIVTYHYVINYIVDKWIHLNKREISLITLMLLLSIGLFIYSGEILIDGVKASIVASAIFLILTTLISNINFTKKFTLKELPELYDLDYEVTNEEIEKMQQALGMEQTETPNMPKIPKFPSSIAIPSKKTVEYTEKGNQLSTTSKTLESQITK